LEPSGMVSQCQYSPGALLLRGTLVNMSPSGCQNIDDGAMTGQWRRLKQHSAGHEEARRVTRTERCVERRSKKGETRKDRSLPIF
jgi:hypothetical protein